MGINYHYSLAHGEGGGPATLGISTMKQNIDNQIVSIAFFFKSISPGLVKTEFRGRLEKRSDPNSAWEDVEGVGGAPVRPCSPIRGHDGIACLLGFLIIGSGV